MSAATTGAALRGRAEGDATASERHNHRMCTARLYDEPIVVVTALLRVEDTAVTPLTPSVKVRPVVPDAVVHLVRRSVRDLPLAAMMQFCTSPVVAWQLPATDPTRGDDLRCERGRRMQDDNDRNKPTAGHALVPDTQPLVSVSL